MLYISGSPSYKLTNIGAKVLHIEMLVFINKTERQYLKNNIQLETYIICSKMDSVVEDKRQSLKTVQRHVKSSYTFVMVEDCSTQANARVKTMVITTTDTIICILDGRMFTNFERCHATRTQVVKTMQNSK